MSRCLEPWLPHAPAQLSEWQANEALGPPLSTESRAEDAARDQLVCRCLPGMEDAHPQAYLFCADRWPDCSTKRSLWGGLPALSFWCLGRRHPNSISLESIVGLRPQSFANVMFV